MEWSPAQFTPRTRGEWRASPARTPPPEPTVGPARRAAAPPSPVVPLPGLGASVRHVSSHFNASMAAQADGGIGGARSSGGACGRSPPQQAAAPALAPGLRIKTRPDAAASSKFPEGRGASLQQQRSFTAEMPHSLPGRPHLVSRFAHSPQAFSRMRSELQVRHPGSHPGSHRVPLQCMAPFGGGGDLEPAPRCRAQVELQDELNRDLGSLGIDPESEGPSPAAAAAAKEKLRRRRQDAWELMQGHDRERAAFMRPTIMWHVDKVSLWREERRVALRAYECWVGADHHHPLSCTAATGLLCDRAPPDGHRWEYAGPCRRSRATLLAVTGLANTTARKRAHMPTAMLCPL
jgi:hypothetical protein